MKIITDTREQRNQKILECITSKGIPFKVKKLDFGDYSIEGYETRIIIERKNSLTELANCFCSGRKRFEAEFMRAKDADAKIFLLIEDEKGREKMLLRRELDKKQSLTPKERQKKTWQSNFTANSMIGSIRSWKEKYNFEIIFCDKKTTGIIIVNLFQKYLDESKDKSTPEQMNKKGCNAGVAYTVDDAINICETKHHVNTHRVQRRFLIKDEKKLEMRG